jgi:glycosyltransferase involved in cell wall biosynthesis
MIKLLNHNGFIEPSLGVIKQGFAVRKKGSVVLQLRENINVKRLNIQLHRTSYDWTQSCIQIRINRTLKYKLRVENIGQKDFSLELHDISRFKDLEISLTLFPQGLVKYIHKTFLGKSKSLLRDSILINKLYLDENKVINYNDVNRFAYGENLKQMQIPVRILGFFGQTFGLAEAARRTFTSLKKSGLPVSATQIPYSGKHHGHDESVKAEKIMPTNFNEIRIFHFNGDYFEKLKKETKEVILDCRYKIGFWHWELPTFPDDYTSWFNYVDEVWVPSKFVFDAIAPKSPKPVQIIPLAIDDICRKPPPPDRIKFNLPIQKVVFLVTFDFYSVLRRKDPISAINGFNKLLSDVTYRDKVHLVVKTSNKHADTLSKKVLDDAFSIIDPEKFTIIENVLPRYEMLQLINSCDSLISLHRAEGFGLHLAEAISMGKLVIATNWSGNTDFMTNRNSFLVDYDLETLKEEVGPYRSGNIWAKPRIEDAVKQMKEIVDLKINNPKLSLPLKTNSLQHLSVNHVSLRLKERISNIFTFF